MEVVDKKKPKRLLIDIPEEVHWLIKHNAHVRNISIKRYVLQAIQMRIKQEDDV